MYIFLYDLLPLAFYFTVFIYLIKKQPFIFVIFFYLFMQQIKNILSNLYVNLNAPVFMREVEKYSTNDGSLFLLIILYMPALFIIYFMYQKRFEKTSFEGEKLIFLTKENTLFFVNFFLYGTLLIELILIIHISVYNTPLFNPNINKNNYWTDYALIPKIKFLSSQLSLLLFINGFIYAKQTLFGYKNRKRFLYYLIVILGIFYYILMKQKFGGPLLMIFSFYLPYFLIGIVFHRINLQKAIKGLIFIFSILLFTIYGYFYMRFGNDALKMIFERVFSLQSEIWEVTYQYFMSNKLPFDNNEFLKELSILFGFSDDGYTGMQYVMSKVMEPDYFNFFINIHINLSSAYPSYLFYLFDDPHAKIIFIYIIDVLLYTVYIFLGFKVVEKILQNKVITAGLYLKLFFSFKAIIGQVYLTSVFTFKEVLFVILIILVELNFFKDKSLKASSYENIIYQRN